MIVCKTVISRIDFLQPKIAISGMSRNKEQFETSVFRDS